MVPWALESVTTLSRVENKQARIMTSAILQHACLARACRGLGKGIDGGAGALGGLLGNDAEDGDGDSRCAKDDELCDAAAIEQVDGELHQDARSIGRSCAGGELGVILECQRKGVVRCGTQQTESKERTRPESRAQAGP